MDIINRLEAKDIQKQNIERGDPIFKDAIAEIESLRKQAIPDGWICVADKWPDDGQYVDIYMPNYGICTACFTKGVYGVYWYCRGQEQNVHPTHWAVQRSKPNPPAMIESA